MSVADITWAADVVPLGPELANVNSAAQAIFVAFVNKRIPSPNSTFSDDDTNLVRGYLAAHMGALTLLKGKAGPVSSQSAGGLAKSYMVSLTNPLWDTTAYGRMFRTLVQLSPAVAGFVA